MKGIAEINVKALYEKFGDRLTYCKIIHVPKGTQDNSEDYYELYSYTDKFLCFNQERCKIIYISWTGSIDLQSNESQDIEFTLSSNEFKYATQNELKSSDEVWEYEEDEEDDFDWLEAI